MPTFQFQCYNKFPELEWNWIDQFQMELTQSLLLIGDSLDQTPVFTLCYATLLSKSTWWWHPNIFFQDWRLMAGPENNVQTHLAKFQQNQPAAATPKLQLSKKRQVVNNSQNKGASLFCRLTFVAFKCLVLIFVSTEIWNQITTYLCHCWIHSLTLNVSLVSTVEMYIDHN